MKWLKIGKWFSDGSRLELPVPYERYLLLTPISALYLHPDFIQQKEEINKEQIQVFYEIAIQLTQQLTLPKDLFPYYRNNFVAYELRDCISNPGELVDYFEWEMKRPGRNDSRYMLGFRSIEFILRMNIRQIDAEFICSIHQMLTPFYRRYKHPALLVQGCDFSRALGRKE